MHCCKLWIHHYCQDMTTMVNIVAPFGEFPGPCTAVQFCPTSIVRIPTTVNCSTVLPHQYCENSQDRTLQSSFAPPVLWVPDNNERSSTAWIGFSPLMSSLCLLLIYLNFVYSINSCTGLLFEQSCDTVWNLSFMIYALVLDLGKFNQYPLPCEHLLSVPLEYLC